MRRGKSGPLKGRNKWVRPENGINSVQIDADPPPMPKPTGGRHEQPPALKRVGKFALARDPAPPNRPQPAPKPKIAAPPPSSLTKARFKYERPKDSAAAGAVAPPPKLPPTKIATTSGQAEKLKPIVRPGKLRWNKYVRQSIGGENKGLQPRAETAMAAEASSQDPTAAVAAAAASPAPSAAELQLRRRSKRISAASELVRKHQRIAAPQRTQRAMQLLRLGGQFYSIVPGRKGKGRSLKLQQSEPPTNSIISTAPPQNKSIVSKLNPKARSFAPTTTTTAPRLPTFGASSGSKTLLSTRSASKIASTGPAQKQKKPMSRLKGGRVVYCPVYCHTGRCPRRGRGCPLRHDPTKRAVCPLWLRGKCALGVSCPLQHQRRSELMPACVHYLQGRCTNSNCPYLHVDLPADAPHCAAFLRGYCAAGVKCASKHYTLKQIKEERKLVAGLGVKGGEKRKKASKQSGSDGIGDDEKPKKRKKRRGRYFDELPSAEDDNKQELEEDNEIEPEEGDKNNGNSENDDGDDKEDATTSSSSTSEESADTDSGATDAEMSEDVDRDEEEEEDSEPPQKRSRRLTAAPLPDFIGL